MSRQGEQARETPAQGKETELLRQRVEDLENENIHLKISQQANEKVINQVRGAKGRACCKPLKALLFYTGRHWF